MVNAVNEGIEAARALVPIRRPWLMISVNDDEDLHFRKAGNSPYTLTLTSIVVLSDTHNLGYVM